jgi:mono/diheme cytochrome c family protein
MFTFGRLIFGRVETRILVGTLAFLGIMTVTGWVAINEGGRMQSFDQQFLARSIERGAATFAASCAPCHGTDGRGNVGVAPGLDNPQLFGHDFLATVNSQIADLTAEQSADGTSDARKAEITTQLTDLNNQKTSLTNQMQTAAQVGYDPTKPDRLKNLGWGGGLRNFVYTTLIHGRPLSGEYWPSGNPMPAWSQLAGGPLRLDQIDDLTNFVLNYDKGENWTVEDLNAVRQFALVPSLGGGSSAPDQPVGTDVQAAYDQVKALAGDPNNGEQLYTQLACAGCHVAGVVGPKTEGTWTRVETIRLKDPKFASWTGEEYIADSILNPNDYIVPNFQPNLMPQNFGTRIDAQQLADLIAFLKSHDEPLPQ